MGIVVIVPRIVDSGPWCWNTAVGCTALQVNLVYAGVALLTAAALAVVYVLTRGK